MQRDDIEEMRCLDKYEWDWKAEVQLKEIMLVLGSVVARGESIKGLGK